jgi:hypothetical protein
VMILKINPADVVSIPTDYDGAKGRCCAYEVVAEVVGDPAVAFTKAVNGEYNKPTAPVKPYKAPVQQAAWPFGPVAEEDSAEEDSTDGEQLYDLVRVHGDWVEYENMTYEDAIEQVEKNIRQKKAQLKIVKADTDEEV